MPFVQGQLQDRFFSALFTSECAHCSKPLHIDMDSDLQVRVHEPTEPLIFFPHVDFAKLEDPSIIGVF